MNTQSDAPHTAPDTQDTNADSGSYDDEPEDNKPKIMIKIRDDASEQPQVCTCISLFVVKTYRHAYSTTCVAPSLSISNHYHSLSVLFLLPL